MEEASLVLLAAVLALLSAFPLAASEFCVCRSDQPAEELQKVIDFSCSPQGGADCSAIQQSGGCYNPNTVPAHCSWAANSYYQNNKARGATCDFGGAATISTTDPSFSGCTFPTTASSVGTTPGTTTVGGATTTGTGTFSPGMGTGTNGTTGMGSSLGPTGTGSMDGAAAGLLPGVHPAGFLAVAILSFLALH